MKFFIDALQNATPIEAFLLGVLLVYFVGKGIIKLPFVNIGKSNSSNKSHYNCELHSDFNKIIENNIKIIRIKTVETLYEQMSNLEVIHEDITVKMKTIFNNMCKNEAEIERYSDLVSVMEHEVKNVTRKFYRDNHFTSRSEIEFSNYVDEKVDHLISRVVYHLDTRYKGYSISRDKLQKANEKELVPYARTKFRKAFYDARAISYEKEKQIRELEE